MGVYRPSEGAVEEDPIISLVGEALRMGSDGRRRVGEVWRCSGGAVRPTVMMVASSHRWLRTLARSDIGFVGGAKWLTVNLVL